MMAKRIMVVGALRSGTSLLTNLIRLWGAYAGEEGNFTQADEWNEHGYHEYWPLRDFNTELLAAVRAQLRLPPDDQGKAQLVEHARGGPFRERGLQLLSAMDEASGARPWVWKDPRLPMLLPFWTALWQDVIYVVAVRHPVDIALSAARMIPRHFKPAGAQAQAAGAQGATGGFADVFDKSLSSGRAEAGGFPFSAPLLYWQRLMLETLSFTGSGPRTIFVHHERFVQDPQGECGRLSAFLRRHCDMEGHDPAQVARMADAISPQLKHFHDGRPLKELPVATPEQHDLYELLKAKVDQPDLPFDAARFALYPGWREYLECLEQLLQTSMALKGLRATASQTS